MTVDLERTDGKHWHVAIGPVEKWVVAIVAAAFIGGIYSFASNQKEQGEKIQTLVTQQAVANSALVTISGQLTDVPQLRRDVVELKVRIEAVEEAQKELRQTRGLR